MLFRSGWYRSRPRTSSAAAPEHHPPPTRNQESATAASRRRQRVGPITVAGCQRRWESLLRGRKRTLEKEIGEAPPSRLEQVGLLAERVARLRLARAREIRAIKLYADPFLLIFQSRPLREREQAPPSSVLFRSGWYRSRPRTSLRPRRRHTSESDPRRRTTPNPNSGSGDGGQQAAPAGRSDCGSLIDATSLGKSEKNSRKRTVEKEIGEAPPSRLERGRL